jgi:hypothetical protein
MGISQRAFHGGTCHLIASLIHCLFFNICYHGHVARIVIVGGGLTPVDAFNLSWNRKAKRLLVFLGSCSVVL